MDLEEKRQREKERFGNEALFWINLANQSDAEINKRLLTISGILIPLTAAPQFLNVQLLLFQKIIVMLILICLLHSIFFGIFQLFVDKHFFARYSYRCSYIESMYEKKKYSKAKEVIDCLEPLDVKANDTCSALQQIFFVAAIFLMIIAILSILFQNEIDQLLNVIFLIESFTTIILELLKYII